MRHISLFMAGLVAAGALCSCNDDKEPVFHQSAPIELQQPAIDDNYTLTEEGQVTLDCTSPDYGFASATSYVVEVSLSPDYVSVADMDDGSGPAPDFVTLPDIYPSRDITVSDHDIASAICQLRGITSESNYTPTDFEPLYVRVRAYQAPAKAESEVTSNTISINVKGYFVSAGPAGPDAMYVPGGPDWGFSINKLVPDDKYETYAGFVYLKDEFKVTDAPGWGQGEYGNGGPGKLEKGGGNIKAPAEGLFYMTVNYAKLTYKLTEIESIGLVGDFNGWNEKEPLEMTHTEGDYLTWTTTGDLSGGWKFVFNRNWDINLGGTPEELVMGGANINVAGHKTITLNLSKVPYTFTAE